MGSCLSSKREDFGYIKVDNVLVCKNYDNHRECNMVDSDDLWSLLNSYLYLFNNISTNYARNDEYLKFFETIQNLERICTHTKLCCSEEDLYKYSKDLREKWYSINTQIIQRMFLKIDMECKTINSVKERMLEEYRIKLEIEKKREIEKFRESDRMIELSLLKELSVPAHVPRDENKRGGGGEPEQHLRITEL